MFKNNARLELRYSKNNRGPKLDGRSKPTLEIRMEPKFYIRDRFRVLTDLEGEKRNQRVSLIGILLEGQI